MKHTLGTILLFIVGIGILGGVARFIYQVAGPDNDYKAVVLTSGDVYFAKVQDGFGRYLVLHDIFYPQVIQGAQGQQSEIQIVKFGGEIHGPQDEMEVNRNQVIMIQPLRPDSQVVKTITQYKSK